MEEEKIRVPGNFAKQPAFTGDPESIGSKTEIIFRNIRDGVRAANACNNVTH
jgi:hypothetical protein